MKSTITAFALVSFSALVVGCADPKVPVQETKAEPKIETRTTYVPPAAVEAPKPVQTESLNVAEDIVTLCKIERTPAPKFDFNTSDLRSGDKALLQKLAKCMTEGALKGRSVSLTGRADQRGETEYNMALGERRASAAHRYLSSLGVKGDRLQTTSRGELDATGTDDSSMQEDRRCDIDLVK
jgi:peptidoglycan-associated lipoprotein